MATYTKRALSGSTHGRGVLVVATAIGSGTTIHTASSTTTEGEGDVVTLFALNGDTSSRILVIGWGGTTDPDDLITQTLSSKAGLSLIVADMLIRNSLVIKASADVASKVTIFGYVNRIA